MVGESERYQLDKQLYTGPIESWSGLDRTLDRPVTIRLLDPESEIGKRVQLQARSLTRLEHSALLHVLDTVEVGGKFGLVTESLPERNLEEYLSLNGTISLSETSNLRNTTR
ncbi:MAG: hypothetical protein ACJZ4L_01055 [Candidatus Poriferisodalaceae bacterium]